MTRSAVQRGLRRGATAGVVVSSILLVLVAVTARSKDGEISELISWCAVILGLPISPIVSVIPEVAQDMEASLFVLIFMVAINWTIWGAAIGFLAGRSRKPPQP